MAWTKAKARAYNRRYYAANKERLKRAERETSRKDCEWGRSDLNGNSKENRRRLMRTVKELLGGKCACCGVDMFDFLTVDHRNGDGGGYKRPGHYYVYRAIYLAFERNEGLEEVHAKYQLLCWNCNVSSHKGTLTCAHTGRPRPTDGLSKWALRMRQRISIALKALGDICACCGESLEEFLTIDHINNDGHDEPRTGLGLRNHLAYYKRVERAFEARDFERMVELRKILQVLCQNCNHSKHYGRGVCQHFRRDFNWGPMTHPEWPYATPDGSGVCG